MLDIHWDPEVTRSLSPFKIVFTLIDGVHVNEDSTEIERVKEEVVNRLKALPLEVLKDNKIIRKYRDFYWHELKIDPTKTRPASEALIRKVLQLKGLSHILNVVDAYNLASIDTFLSFSAYDYSTLQGKLRIHLSKHADSFLGIGMDEPRYLDLRTLVISDALGVICVYPHRDAVRTKITNTSKSLLLMTAGVPGLSLDTLKEGTSIAIQYIKRVAGGMISSEEILPPPY